MTLTATLWGVPGAVFTTAYVVLLVVAFVVVVLAPDRLDPSTATAAADLRPVELAYLADGDRLAVTTALAALRGDDLVDDDARPVADSAAPTEPVQAATLNALRRAGTGRGRALSTLLTDPGIHRALRELEAGLDARGLLRTGAEHTRARRWSLLLWAVAALGIVRLVALGVAGQALGGGLVAATGGALALAFGASLVGAASSNRRAAATLREARAANPRLRTEVRPVAPAFRAPDVPLAVALFGWRRLTDARPELGRAVDLHEVFDPSTGVTSAS